MVIVMRPIECVSMNHDSGQFCQLKQKNSEFWCLKMQIMLIKLFKQPETNSNRASGGLVCQQHSKKWCVIYLAKKQVCQIYLAISKTYFSKSFFSEISLSNLFWQIYLNKNSQLYFWRHSFPNIFGILARCIWTVCHTKQNTFLDWFFAPNWRPTWFC